MTDFTLSDEQNNARKAFLKWFRSGPGRKPFFYLAGYAGTGKTTIAKSIARSISGDVLFAAFTGKAAVVMRTKGCENASTIHSLIYKSEEDDNGIITYSLNFDSPLQEADLIIIDECSMVGEELGKDLLRFNTPVLVLGDPAQLPPVGGEGFFTSGEPDFLLTEIHRQAESNPIIAMSMAVRHEMTIPFGWYGESRIVRAEDFDSNEMTDFDQVICGTNKTRMWKNQQIRKLRGFDDAIPMLGERLVCLKNDRKYGLLNGGLWDVIAMKKRYANATSLVVEPVDEGIKKNPVQVYVHDLFWEGKEQELDWRERKRFNEFTYGYALSCHKAQGSQWDNLLVFDESNVFREEKFRWLYTAITRAAEKVTVVV